MNWSVLFGLTVRHAVNALATVLVSHGWLLAKDQTSWGETTAGIAVGAGAWIWSVWQKSAHRQQIVAEVTSRLNFRGASALAFAVMVLSGLPSLASDLPAPVAVKKALVTALTAEYDWSGFYAAVGAGGAFTKGRVDFITLPESSNINPAGVMLGAEIGARYQFGAVVAGLEAGGYWNNERGSVPCDVLECKLANTWFAHATPHIGFTAGQAIANVGALNAKLTNPLKLASVTAPQPSVLFWFGPDLAFRDAKLQVSDGSHAEAVRFGKGVRAGVDVPVSNLFFGIEGAWDKFDKFDCIPGVACPTALQVKFREWSALARIGFRF